MPQASLLTYFSTSSATASRAARSEQATRDGPARPSGPQYRVSTRFYSKTESEILSPRIPAVFRNAANPDLNEGQSTTPTIGKAIIAEVNPVHVSSLKRLTSALLPIRYPDSFFTGAVEEDIPARLSRTVLVDGTPVGWIRCRLEIEENMEIHQKSSTTHPQVYIQALCLSPPHRGQGLAAAMLEAVCRTAIMAVPSAESICAHVWECNSDALEWYEKRGFKRVILIQAYYRKLRPAGAWLVRKDLV